MANPGTLGGGSHCETKSLKNISIFGLLLIGHVFLFFKKTVILSTYGRQMVEASL